jgi:hypothetical protein
MAQQDGDGQEGISESWRLLKRAAEKGAMHFSELVYTEAATAEWIFPQEKSTSSALGESTEIRKMP